MTNDEDSLDLRVLPDPVLPADEPAAALRIEELLDGRESHRRLVEEMFR